MTVKFPKCKLFQATKTSKNILRSNERKTLAVATNKITNENDMKAIIFFDGESSPAFRKRRRRIIFAISELSIFVIDINSFALG
mmetsp:Transcript_14160/g.19329  ORF Transcript_14160/g.19329 Transcript_14160/m.19329 type:complete len:84 (-) Transcript_14160:10-261(-)